MDFFKSIVFYIIGVPISEQNKLKTNIKKYGGSFALQVNKSVHYLITTPGELEKPTYKLQAAIKLCNEGELRIVSARFVIDSAEAGRILPDDRYQLHSGNVLAKSSAAAQKFKFSGAASSPSSSAGGDSQKKQCFNVLELLAEGAAKDQADALPDRVVRLFISSTFTDMAEEREMLVGHLMAELQAFCRERQLDFSFVDLRWGISREQSQRLNSITTCMNEVAGCTHFLSLLGSRYGWCEGDLYDSAFKVAQLTRPWMNEYKGRSVTELEILQATKYAPTTKNHFFYIKSESGSSAVNDNTPAGQENLNRLKSLIKDHKLLNMSYTQSDLNAWMKSVYRDITESIEAQYPLANQQLHGQLQLDIDMNISYLKQLSKVYLQCNIQAIQSLNDYVKSNGQQNQQCPLLMVGESGVGKSTHLAHWLINELPKIVDVKKTFVIHTVVGLSPKSHQMMDVLRSAFETIKAATSTPVPIPDDEAMLREDIDYWFSVATRDNKKLIWIIDGIERLGYSYTIDAILPRQLNDSVKIILSTTTSKQTETTKSLSQLYPRCAVVPVTKFSSADMRAEFCSMYLSVIGKSLDGKQLDRLSKIDQTPLFLSMVLNELIATATFETIDSKLEAMLKCTTSELLFQSIIIRWKNDTLYPANLVQDTLNLLYHSESGLYEEEIMSILNLTNTSGFISAARGILSMDGRGHYLKLHSQALREAVRKNIIVESDTPKYFDILSSYFSRSSCTALPKRIAQLLPRFHKSSNNRKSLESLLLRLDYFALLINEYGNAGLLAFWHFTGTDVKQLVHLYRTEFANYKAPLQEQAETTRLLGLFFEYLSFYDDAWAIMDTARDLHVQLNGDVSLNVQLDIESLATITLKQSKLDTSIYLSEKSLAIAESIFGADQYGTCESLMLVGIGFKKQANYDQALEYYQKAINAVYRFFGYKPNETSGPHFFNSKLANLYLNLGDIYRKKAIYDTASQYYQKTLTILNNIRKRDDMSFAELYRDLGLVEKKLGHYLEATEYYTKALDIVKIRNGTNHANYGLYLCDLADTKRKEDKYTEAEAIYNQALEIITVRISPNCIEVAEIYNNLGLIRKKLGHYKEAIEFYKKALVIGEKSLGKDHTKIGFFTHNLGDCYRKLGDYKQCEPLFARSLSISQNHFGFDHPEVAEILNSMGLVYKKQSKYQLAEKEYKRAISIVSKALGADHPKHGIYTSNLADVYRKTGKYEAAKSLYNKALLIIEKSLGKEHSEYAEVLYGLGLLNLSLQQFDKALEFTQNAISITRADLGNEHPKIGIYLNSLCEIKIAREKANQPRVVTDDPYNSNDKPAAVPKKIEPFSIEEIRTTYESAYRILVADLGAGHPEIADLWTNRAELEFQYGSHQRSKEYFAKALEIIKETFGTEHTKYVTISDRLRYFTGDVIQAPVTTVEEAQVKPVSLAPAHILEQEKKKQEAKLSDFDVELVMSSLAVSKEVATGYLRRADGDVVNAILLHSSI